MSEEYTISATALNAITDHVEAELNIETAERVLWRGPIPPSLVELTTAVGDNSEMMQTFMPTGENIKTKLYPEVSVRDKKGRAIISFSIGEDDLEAYGVLLENSKFKLLGE